MRENKYQKVGLKPISVHNYRAIPLFETWERGQTIGTGERVHMKNDKIDLFAQGSCHREERKKEQWAQLRETLTVNKNSGIHSPPICLNNS